MSFIIPDYSKIFCVSKYCVRYSYVLIAIIPVLLFLFWYSKKTFIRFNNRFEYETYISSKRKERKLVLILRSLAVFFLMIGIASPFILESKTIPGNPRLTILVDNSSSMSLYEPDIASELYKKLEGIMPVNIRTIASGQSSSIGNGILNNLEGNDNILVISDGVNNEGKLLGDIMLFASGINSSVSTLKMESIREDAGVVIDGPAELIKDTEGDFVVRVNVVGKGVPYTLKVTSDDNTVIMEQKDSVSRAFKFTKKFPEGEYHKLTAILTDVGGNDHFQNNNAYYKSVKIVPRPKVLYVTKKSSPLANELAKIYELESNNALPADLSGYMAVLLDDLKAADIAPYIDRLSNYVSDGNGLLFIGGESSFERGGYKGSIIETLLPVKIGASEEQNKSDMNIAIVMDRSQGTEDYISVEKALAISVLESLSEKNNVGVVFFGGTPCEAIEGSMEGQPIGVKPLKESKKILRNLIASVKFDGQSCFNIGLEGGFRMLSNVGGSKDIIFISDGKTTYTKIKEDTYNVVRSINAKGVKVSVVGVGTETDSAVTENNIFLDNIARLGEGIYYKADATNKLKVQFGDKDETQGEEYYNSLIPLDTTHFITLGMDDLHATISGYNYAVPKPAARLLVTTNKNIPILVVWRFGLGKVASLTTDNGLKWGGDLLNKENSKLITKTINWVIGDLSRKKSYDVSIRDAVLGKSTSVNVIAKEIPNLQSLNFAKIDTNLYSAAYMPSETGFKELLGATFATNYNDEYANLGMNPEFTTLVEKTNGKVFEPSDTNGIIEYVKAKSKRIKIDSTDYRWPFAIMALLLFLTEIGYRKYKENVK